MYGLLKLFLKYLFLNHLNFFQNEKQLKDLPNKPSESAVIAKPNHPAQKLAVKKPVFDVSKVVPLI